MPPYSPGNYRVGGPSSLAKHYASSLNEHDASFRCYEHLTGVPNPQDGLLRLRKIASIVKPIMRKRGWAIQVLSEFMPDDARLLGLNINRTYKICIRLRYTHNPSTLLPIEQTVDTMLHELSHIIFGDHDANFHALWDELRGEYETLMFKGYTGEGFLSSGHRLGGGRVPPPSEMRRVARANAEKRRVLQKGSGQKLGGAPVHRTADVRQVIADAAQRRAAIDRGCASGTADAGRLADQAGQQVFRTKAEEDDANNRAIAEALLELMEEEESQKLQGTYATPPASGGLAWTRERGLHAAEPGGTKRDVGMTEEEQMNWALAESVRMSQPSDNGIKSAKRPRHDPLSGARQPNVTGNVGPVKRKPVPQVTVDLTLGTPPRSLTARTTISEPQPSTQTEPDAWTCQICTCINPLQFLACDACGIERPSSLANGKHATKPKAKPDARLNTTRSPTLSVLATPEPATKSLGWVCRQCGTFMEHNWWTCSACGLMKDAS